MWAIEIIKALGIGILGCILWFVWDFIFNFFYCLITDSDITDFYR